MGDRLSSLSSKKCAIYLALLVCLALRMTAALNYRLVPQSGDGKNYVAIARHLANGDGFVEDVGDSGRVRFTAYGCPGYPFFLSVLFRMFPDRPLTVYIVQSMLEVLACFFLFRLALLATRRSAVALLAAVAYTFYPPFSYMMVTGNADSFGYFLLIAAMLALMWASRKDTLTFALAGALMGVAALVKPAMLAFPAVVAIILFARRADCRSWLAKAAVYAAACCLVIAPWTIRNYMVFKSFVPIATHGGQTFWGGTGPADGEVLPHPWVTVGSIELNQHKDAQFLVSPETYKRITSLQRQLEKLDNDVQVDRALTKAAIGEIKRHPARYCSLFIKKFFRLWLHLGYSHLPSKSGLGAAAMHLALLLLAVVGLRWKQVDPFYKSMVFGLFVYLSLIHMITYAHIRYSFPAFPFILILCAAAVVRWLRVDQSADSPKDPACA